MLRWRLSLGTGLIAAIAALAWLEHDSQSWGVWGTLPVLLVLSVLASQEFIALAGSGRPRPLAAVVYVGNLILVASNWLGKPLGFDHSLGSLGPVAVALALAVLASFVVEMWRFQQPGESLARVALTIFALAYVGLLLCFLAQLRLLGDGKHGIAAIASLLIVVKMGDTGAYTVGRLCRGRFFRRKLAPMLSPGKTIEGAIGGLAFACFGAAIAFEWLVPAMIGETAGGTSIGGWLLFGLIVGAAGMAGDLAESLIKREAGRKDSSDWLPGFGGVLDLLDSILLAAPVAYMCWAAGLVTP